MDVDRGQRVYPTPEDIAIVMGLHELANGLKATSLDAYGATTAFAYDSRGNLTARTDGNGNVTSFTFDALGRKTTQTSPDPDGTVPLPAIVATYAYDVVGNLVSTTLGDGRITRGVSDKRQREVRHTAAQGRITRYAYDSTGNRTSAGTQTGQSNRLTFDGTLPLRLRRRRQKDGKVFGYECWGCSHARDRPAE